MLKVKTKTHSKENKDKMESRQNLVQLLLWHLGINTLANSSAH